MINMYHEKTKAGTFRVCERFEDPLTGKLKKTNVTYKSDTPRARRQAERELIDKIEALQNGGLTGNPKQIKTWGQLRDDWLESWGAGVKPQTAIRQELISKRVAQFI